MAKRRAKRTAPKAKPWFVKVRGSYLPNAWQGWLTYVPYTVYLVVAYFVAINTFNNLLSKAFGVLVYWFVGLAIMTWIAARKS